MNVKNLSLAGLIICFTYFIITAALIITQLPIWVTAMEVVTLLAGLYMVLFTACLPFSENKKMFKYLALIAASSCTLLTSLAHTVSLAVTTPLINSGIDVPEYLQIGKWPSVEMAVDYLGWGLFMGLSFILSSCALDKNRENRLLDISLKLCGLLCLIGFLGAVIVNENLWYAAPLGYGIGTAVICGQMLVYKPGTKIRSL